MIYCASDGFQESRMKEKEVFAVFNNLKLLTTLFDV